LAEFEASNATESTCGEGGDLNYRRAYLLAEMVGIDLKDG